MASTVSLSLLPLPQSSSRRISSPISAISKAWPTISDQSKLPAPPWAKNPPAMAPDDVLDLSGTPSGGRKKNGRHGDRSLTETVRGGRSRAAIKKIVRGIARLAEEEESAESSIFERRNRDRDQSAEETLDRISRLIAGVEIEDLDGIGKSHCSTAETLGRIGESKLGKMVERSHRSAPENLDSRGNEHRCRPIGENQDHGKNILRRLSRLKSVQGNEGVQAPWSGYEQQLRFPREKKKRVVTAAEMILPEEVLVKLREEAKGMKNWVKAKKAGVTDDVVDEIRATWRRNELVMVKFVEPLSRNMDRAREIVEIKTGGLVVWTKRDSLVVLRENSNYIHEAEKSSTIPVEDCSSQENKWADAGDSNEPVRGTLYEREVNRLLDGLGPRFVDWWWSTPLPVDADLLPEAIPGFKPPFRVCPPNVGPTLTDDELTYLRNLAPPLPTHFALGKNSGLQGLASAIIKLWEKSPIAKIAVKVGIVNTDNEKMANELKRLTGGVLLLRNKFFIILYRGKDYVSPKVAGSVLERERALRDMQLHEETARLRSMDVYLNRDVDLAIQSEAGTVREFSAIESCYKGSIRDVDSEKQAKLNAEKEKIEKEIRGLERQLRSIKFKLERSEAQLSRLNSKWRLTEETADPEFLTEEERQSLRKIGLKMDEFLLLGRRGVYDGTVASIHMHWKHREVVKVMTFQEEPMQVAFTASLLELQTGGVLVAVEKIRRTHAIIIYRGKNYRPPTKLIPETLLSKSEAMERSIEIQRRGSLKFFYYQRLQAIKELKARLMALERSMGGGEP
ncbi:maize chloroplast splicing factor-like protein isoform X2 [Wolffia australiana]